VCDENDGDIDLEPEIRMTDGDGLAGPGCPS
jgi:hypothetical protein